MKKLILAIQTGMGAVAEGLACAISGIGVAFFTGILAFFGYMGYGILGGYFFYRVGDIVAGPFSFSLMVFKFCIFVFPIIGFLWGAASKVIRDMEGIS